jgi:hypothetical protein
MFHSNIMKAGFQVLTEVLMPVLWVVAPCSLVEILPTFQRLLLPPSSGSTVLCIVIFGNLGGKINGFKRMAEFPSVL